jgi:hypothetical protein
MKTMVLIGLGTFIFSFYSFAASVCSQKEADLLQKVNKLDSSGFSDAMTLNMASTNLLKAQFICGEISKAVFCSSAISEEQKYVTVITNLSSNGTVDVSEVIKARKQLLDIQMSCN